MDYKNIGFNEIMAIKTLPVLSGTVATLHAASTVSSVEDYRYALRCKKAGVKIKVRKPAASNSNTNKCGSDKAEQRVKLALRGSLRARLSCKLISADFN